jgi:Domain of unknown function (DUF4278)
MNLSYRGIAYQTTAPTVEAIETEHTGRFLGKSFPIKRFNIAKRHTDSIVLTYRGTHYSH